MTQKLIMSHGVANQKFLDLAGDAANGIILPAGRLIVADQLAASDLQKKVLLAYKKEFEGKYNKPVSTFGGHAYDAFEILAGALKKVGTDPEKLRAELEKTKFAGCGGVFTMSATDHEGLTKDAFVMVQVEGGKWKMLK
jgi:branched-chain amino acid transport system substrate-binding protein